MRLVTTSKRIELPIILEWLFEPELDRENIRSVKKLSREKSYLSYLSCVNLQS